MRMPDPDDEVALRKILERQKRLSFDFEKSINWSRGIDMTRFFVPLDRDNLVFPEASPEQRLAISQYLGLIIAQTAGEMETALLKAKDLVWKKNLERHPVNPEFEALGEQFFAEEEKHSKMFKRFLTEFAAETGVEYKELQRILPVVSGTLLDRTLKINSDIGGHALWWVLMLVEEVSILMHKQLRPFKDSIDPLYFEIHRRHFEEEVRHSPYPYWMLQHLYKRGRFPTSVFFRKTDVLLAQALEISWTLSSLSRIRNVYFLRKKHPFYANLTSCIPLIIRLSPIEVIRRLFVSAPFVSLILNPVHHDDFHTLVEKLRGIEIPLPKPQPQQMSAS